MTSRVITQGSVLTQIRWTKEEAEQLLLGAALADNPDLSLPDFGEGDGDTINVSFRSKNSTAVDGILTDDLELTLALTDVENDPIAAPSE